VSTKRRYSLSLGHHPLSSCLTRREIGFAARVQGCRVHRSTVSTDNPAETRSTSPFFTRQMLTAIAPLSIPSIRFPVTRPNWQSKVVDRDKRQVAPVRGTARQRRRHSSPAEDSSYPSPVETQSLRPLSLCSGRIPRVAWHRSSNGRPGPDSHGVRVRAPHSHIIERHRAAHGEATLRSVRSSRTASLS